MGTLNLLPENWFGQPIFATKYQIIHLKINGFIW